MKNFKSLNLSDKSIKTLKKERIYKPTKIQNMVIPKIQKNKDLIVKSPTGTGKTLAFLLPILEDIDPKNKNIQCLILTPTRELATQITKEATKFAKNKKINILKLFGGKSLKPQRNKLEKNIHLVIATTGRLIDHIHRNNIDLTKINYLILDEVDHLLEMGFKEDIENIIKFSNKNRQTLCFSATIDSNVKKLAYKYMTDPNVVSNDSIKEILKNIKQFKLKCTPHNKREKIVKLLKNENPFMAIIFVRTKRRVDELDLFLGQNNFDCKKLHGDMKQNKRKRRINSFRKLEFKYLIATDVAARGLDINGITHIINYDMPDDLETYIHRIGRTGRQGNKGKAFSFITKDDKNLIKKIKKQMKVKNITQ